MYTPSFWWVISYLDWKCLFNIKQLRIPEGRSYTSGRLARILIHSSPNYYIRLSGFIFHTFLLANLHCANEILVVCGSDKKGPSSIDYLVSWFMDRANSFLNFANLPPKCFCVCSLLFSILVFQLWCCHLSIGLDLGRTSEKSRCMHSSLKIIPCGMWVFFYCYYVV
jgi:hypothetical protein